MSDGTPFLRVAADRIGAPGSARIAGKNAIPRHQRRQLASIIRIGAKMGRHSKGNCTSSGFESHSTGWEVSIWGIPTEGIYLANTLENPKVFRRRNDAVLETVGCLKLYRPPKSGSKHPGQTRSSFGRTHRGGEAMHTFRTISIAAGVAMVAGSPRPKSCVSVTRWKPQRRPALVDEHLGDRGRQARVRSPHPQEREDGARGTTRRILEAA